MIKAVYLDFDSTLYSHVTDCIPKSALKAISMMQKNGIKVFLCTGRAPMEMNWFDLGGLKLDGYVYNNGQLVLDENNNVILSIALEGKLKEIMVDLFVNKTIPVYFATVDDIFLNYNDIRVDECQRKVGSPVPHVGEYHDEPIYMCSAFVDENEIDNYDIKKYGEVTYWQEGAIDICPKNGSKVTGIEAMNKYLGITMDEVMGIGDGHNDLEMLKACGIGVCMGNGKDEVKKISDYVTTDVDDDGIYNACKHYNLI